MSLSYKQAVAQRFSAAASRYDRVAHLQRSVCTHLFHLLPMPLNVTTLLDMGAGTGYGSHLLKQHFTSARILALDLALGMLNQLQQEVQTPALICADMENLPLKANCLDLIFSSLAVQWSLNFSQTLNQCFHVLRPGGIFAFSTVLEGSLIEFKHSWSQVDERQHINTFRTQAQYQTLCAQSGFDTLLIQPQTQRYFYDDIAQLRHELRDLGANHIQTGRQPHLAARQRLEKLQQAYERYRTPAGLPATWNLLYVILKKPA